MLNALADCIENIGKKIVDFFNYVGQTTLLLIQSFIVIFVPPFKTRRIIQQVYKIGVTSFALVFLTAFFTGMVLALQSAYSIRNITDNLYIVGSLVSLSMTRELGPVLTALVIAGRVGASIAAEIGSMKVTEQIDALRTLASNPIKYLVAPRLAAIMISLPLLTIIADFVGMLGGYVIGTTKLGITHTLYKRATFDILQGKDIYTGLLKAFSFGVIICIVACFEGFRTKEGAEGVGKATTESVVISFILIIAMDCLLTAVFYFVG